MFPCLGMSVNCVKVFTGRESVVHPWWRCTPSDIHTLHGETSCGGARVFSPQFHLISCEYPQDPLFQSNDCRDLHNWDGNTPYPQGNTLNIVFDFFWWKWRCSLTSLILLRGTERPGQDIQGACFHREATSMWQWDCPFKIYGVLIYIYIYISSIIWYSPVESSSWIFFRGFTCRVCGFMCFEFDFPRFAIRGAACKMSAAWLQKVSSVESNS